MILRKLFQSQRTLSTLSFSSYCFAIITNNVITFVSPSPPPVLCVCGQYKPHMPGGLRTCKEEPRTIQVAPHAPVSDPFCPPLYCPLIQCNVYSMGNSNTQYVEISIIHVHVAICVRAYFWLNNSSSLRGTLNLILLYLGRG